MATGIPTHTVLVPKPLSHTLPVLTSPAQFKLLVCGRRWGKTGAAINAALRGHGPKPGHFRGLADGAKIWWVGPNSTSLDASQVWPQLKRALQFCTAHKNEVTRTITLLNGGYISVRSADGQNRGSGLDGIIFDEAAFAEEVVWKEELRATISDHDGWAIVQTTPNGRNWIHQEFVDVPNRPRWARWQCPSSDNPLMTRRVLDEIKGEIGPRRFAQEYEAQFMEVEGALWPASYFGDDIWAGEWPESFELSAIGVDPSMGASETSDYSAIVFAGLTQGRFWIDASIARRSPMQIIADTYAMDRQLKPDAVGVESDGFQAVLAPLFGSYAAEHGLAPLPLYKITSEKAKKIARIQRVDPHLSAGNLRFRKTAGCQTLIEQMMMFPLKQYHDDGPDALEMALRLIGRMQSQVSVAEEFVRP